MFTGIIEEVGRIKEIHLTSVGHSLTILASKILQDTSIGDSIAVNGICLTVTHLFSDSFQVDVMPVSAEKSTLSFWQIGQSVNLERALRWQDRMGGHLVSGHIDGIGKIVSIQPTRNAVMIRLEIPEKIGVMLIPEGSLALDGISVTIAELRSNECTISIIPHTLENTTLSAKKVGDPINLESDLIGKYVYYFNKPAKKLDKHFLTEHGFL